MDSTIQPLLCCIGDAASVKPTQFLMERALAALHGDWRVITVEIQPDDIQAAIAGLRAMRFTAIRFFGELQQTASQWLCNSQPSTASITSAMRVDEQWTCWDNIGFGLLNLIQNACRDTTLVWLCDDTRITQSLSVAMASNNERSWKVFRQPTSNPESDVTLDLQNMVHSFERDLDIVIVGDDPLAAMEILKQLQITDEANLIFATSRMVSRSILDGQWQRGTLKVLSPNDLAVAAEAYDFKRWTGKDVDLEQLRDAYDEYVDF
jgi:hypothetical protein